MSKAKHEAARLRSVQRLYHSPRYGDDGPTDVSLPKGALGTDNVSTPDSALMAFLQLVTIRLSKQRAMISLVDQDHQVCTLAMSNTLLKVIVFPS